MKRINILIALALFLSLGIMSCKKDEPTPAPEVVPTAAFDFVTDELKVVFENKSKDATKFTWNFGDGNTSTDVNPTHTYSKSGKYTVKLKAENASKSKETSKEVEVKAYPYKKEGQYLISVASSSAGSTWYGGYFPDAKGDIDLTAKKAYQRVTLLESVNGFMYGWPVDRNPGLTKYAVDVETDDLVEVGNIPELDSPRDMVYISDDLAFYTFFSVPKLVAFNPSTMKKIKEIDLSKAFKPEGMDRTGYSGIFYNPNNKKLYLTLAANIQATPQYYDLDDVYVEVIDVPSQAWEKTIVHKDAEYPLHRGNSSAVLDAEGNLYLLTQGTYGLDNKFGPRAPKGSRPQILKITKDSAFDTDYSFNPINKAGFENNFFQLCTNLIGTGTNKAYAIGTAQTDSPQILQLLRKFATSGLSDAEFQQLVGLVLYDASMKLMEVDLVTKEVKAISDMPKTAGFGYPLLYYYNNKVYSQTTANGGMYNGYYEYDPATNTSKPLYNLTAGGLATHFVDLASTFR